jgi:hypothetical protein
VIDDVSFCFASLRLIAHVFYPQGCRALHKCLFDQVETALAFFRMNLYWFMQPFVLCP